MGEVSRHSAFLVANLGTGWKIWILGWYVRFVRSLSGEMRTSSTREARSGMRDASCKSVKGSLLETCVSEREMSICSQAVAFLLSSYLCLTGVSNASSLSLMEYSLRYVQLIVFQLL